jgi:hypothetical protein
VPVMQGIEAYANINWIGLGMHIRDRKILEEIGVHLDCHVVAPIIIGYRNSKPPASERHAPDILKII